MATFSIDDLVTPLETEEIKTNIYDALAVTGVTTTLWKPGAVVRTIIAIVAVILHALSVLVSNIARSGFLSLASATWLRLKALYDYNEEFQAATFAAGTVYVSNSSGGVYLLDADDLEVASSLTGKSYRNTASVTINALASNVAVSVQAVEAGAASSALPGEVDRVVTALAGLTVTNTATLVGLDDESDEQLRARCSAKLGSFSPNGPPDVYDYVAKSAVRSSNGSRIGVTRVRTKPDGLGGIDIYCATATGALTAPDLADVDEAIQTQAAPLGITARTWSATEVSVPITYSVWCYNTTGLREDQIRTAISETLIAYIAAQNVGGNEIEGAGGKLYRDDIAAEISRARTSDGASLRVFRAIVHTPAADVPLGVFEVPVIGAVVDTAIVRVAPPRGAV
jgi:hypothetical protein